MAFRKPISTLGGLMWWSNIKQSEYFIMQEHTVGPPLWPYCYRILMRENRMEIANSNDASEINLDWEYLKKHAVPQFKDRIDIGKALSSEVIMSIVMNVVKGSIGKKP